MIEGGIQEWTKHYPLQTGGASQKRTPAVYKFTVDNQSLITCREIKADPALFTLVDTRSWLEWIKGSLPGAVHIPWTDFYTGDTRQPISASALSGLLKEHGVSLEKPVVYFCTGGIRSGYAWMVHELAGLPPALNFEGGVEAWQRFQKK